MVASTYSPTLATEVPIIIICTFLLHSRLTPICGREVRKVVACLQNYTKQINPIIAASFHHLAMYLVSL